MFEVHKAKRVPVTVIRAASGHELSNYEKAKLEQIEPGAQVNKLETVLLNGKQLQVTKDKAVNIELGEHALKPHITPADLSADDLFIIECELDENILKEV